MKKSKRTIIMLCLILTAILSLLCLTSCGDMLSGVTGSSGTKNEATTSKIEFADAAKNFDNKDVKKSDITVKVKGTLFANQSTQAKTRKDSYSIGSTINIERVQDVDKMYVSANIKSSDTDTEVGGLIDSLRAISGTTATDILASFSRLGLEGSAFRSDINKYLTILHHYVTDQLEAGVEVGIEDGTYNLKAHYSDKESGEEDEVWIVTDNTTLFSFINTAANISVPNDVINSYLMKTSFSALKKGSNAFAKDSANKMVDKSGESEYDIHLNTQVIASAIFDGILNLLGVTDSGTVLSDYADYFSDMQNWFTLETQNVCADVKDDLPKSVKTGGKLIINIDTDKVNKMLEKLSDAGVIEETDQMLARFVINVIQSALCGTDGDEKKIGIELSMSIKEAFSYGEKECQLDDSTHRDYFIGIDEEVEGRFNLNDFISKEVKDIDTYIAEFLSSLGEEYAEEIEEIRAKIYEKIDELTDKVTLYDVIAIIREVMKDYIKAPEENEEGDESGSINEEKAKEFAEDAINQLLDRFGKK